MKAKVLGFLSFGIGLLALSAPYFPLYGKQLYQCCHGVYVLIVLAAIIFGLSAIFHPTSGRYNKILGIIGIISGVLALIMPMLIYVLIVS
jgi:hypothetical protein